MWNLPRIYMVPKMAYKARHVQHYGEEACYAYARLAIRRMMRAGHITTKKYGVENLPGEGGYILAPNHQGKYDALGIMISHARQSIGVIKEVAEDTKRGRRFIIFPEGGYYHNHNTVGDFKPGCFKSAVKARAPIVPVALIDSYKVFEEWTLKKVETQVHFLKAIPYEEYKGMTTTEIAEMVRDRIVSRISEVLSPA